MYFLEWTLAMGRRKHKPGSWFDDIQKDIVEDNKKDAKKMMARGVRYDPDALEIDVKESRSELLDDNGSIYRKTKTYLDVCTYNDDKRGLITLVMSVVCLYLVGGVDFLVSLLREFVTGYDASGEVVYYDADLFFPLIALGCVVPLIWFVFFRYLLKAWHLEAFTMRRLVVRFNRETRKVYLLRPGFLGGVKAYDWEMIDVGLPKDMPNHQGIGGMLVLAARAESTDNPHSPLGVDGAFIGLPSPGLPAFAVVLGVHPPLHGRRRGRGAGAETAAQQVAQPLEQHVDGVAAEPAGWFRPGTQLLVAATGADAGLRDLGPGPLRLAAVELRGPLPQGDSASERGIGTALLAGTAGLQLAAAAVYRCGPVVVLRVAAWFGLAFAAAVLGRLKTWPDTKTKTGRALLA
ncbi:hypothetical protein JOS77_17655 [Chromobacterium haemolyticum]|nr:hypothetical protein JOS77_17655 [Chromobacterium haemolyticum]